MCWIVSLITGGSFDVGSNIGVSTFIRGTQGTHNIKKKTEFVNELIKKPILTSHFGTVLIKIVNIPTLFYIEQNQHLTLHSKII